MVNMTCRWGTSSSSSFSAHSAQISSRFMWQDGQMQRSLQEKATK